MGSRNRTMSYVPAGRRKVRPAIDYANHPTFAGRPKWRQELHRIIFGHLTPAGKLFDILLIGAIMASVVVVMLDSVEAINDRSGDGLRIAEWTFTILFTIEYALRLIAAARALTYARTFFGVVDLLSILPTYLSLIIPGGEALAIIRVLRVLRVFRVLKLAQFIGGEQLLIRALRSSVHKIAVFLVAVLTLVVVMGAMMYVVEGAEAGFTSIPRSVYWAIVTVTTVGFGDITPQSPLGQALAAALMIVGYGVIAVPTGIVGAEIASQKAAEGTSARSCPACAAEGHEADARHCKLCGTELPD